MAIATGGVGLQEEVNRTLDTLNMVLPVPRSVSPSQATRYMHELEISFYRYPNVFHTVLAGLDLDLGEG